MSFEIDGKTWIPQSASEHTNSILERVNAILQEEGVTDEKGEVVQLKASYGNALYLLALGDGNRVSLNDEKLSKAINSFNIELCDDTQIQNLLPIAAMTRNAGSKSTLLLTATAADSGECVIPAGTKAPYGDVNFVVTQTVTIPAGNFALVPTVCDTVGAVTVLTGEVTAFDTSIANLESVENRESSVPGTNPETVPELRQRLLRGDTIRYTTDGCKNELEALTGVSYARVYFNYDPVNSLTLPGDVILQPRHAYIVIYGDSDKIAETYVRFMSAQTQNDPNAEGTPSVVDVKMTAVESDYCSVPAGCVFTYNGKTYSNADATIVAAGTTETVTFTCSEIGPNEVPAGAVTDITYLGEPIANLESFYNEAAEPGYNDPKMSQTYVTNSGQLLEVKYDKAAEKKIFVKIVLAEGADYIETVTDNQLKRDLISASASWGIGAAVTSLLASKPFTDITYTKVAYVLISEDGTDGSWTNLVQMGANVVPRIYDGTVFVRKAEDEASD